MVPSTDEDEELVGVNGLVEDSRAHIKGRRIVDEGEAGRVGCVGHVAAIGEELIGGTDGEGDGGGGDDSGGEGGGGGDGNGDGGSVGDCDDDGDDDGDGDGDGDGGGGDGGGRVVTVAVVTKAVMALAGWAGCRPQAESIHRRRKWSARRDGGGEALPRGSAEVMRDEVREDVEVGGVGDSRPWP